VPENSSVPALGWFGPEESRGGTLGLEQQDFRLLLQCQRGFPLSEMLLAWVWDQGLAGLPGGGPHLKRQVLLLLCLL